MATIFYFNGVSRVGRAHFFVPDISTKKYAMLLDNSVGVSIPAAILLGNDKAVAQPTHLDCSRVGHMLFMPDISMLEFGNRVEKFTRHYLF